MYCHCCFQIRLLRDVDGPTFADAISKYLEPRVGALLRSCACTLLWRSWCCVCIAHVVRHQDAVLGRRMQLPAGSAPLSFEPLCVIHIKNRRRHMLTMLALSCWPAAPSGQHRCVFQVSWSCLQSGPVQCFQRLCSAVNSSMLQLQQPCHGTAFLRHLMLWLHKAMR